jgi:hypothetical protein
LVEMGAPERRDALDQLEAVREEDADKWAVGGVEQALDRRAVDGHALWLSGGEADGELVWAGGPLRGEHDARGAGAEANELPVRHDRPVQPK